MISYLSGTLADWTEDSVVVETGGVGFSVQVPPSSIGRLPAIGSQIKLYTTLLVSENDLQLAGFLSKEELRMFHLLRRVNKVGTKIALSLLSTMSVSDLSFAIASQDAKTIAKTPGVGVKLAEKLILELKDRVSDGLVSEEFAATAQQGGDSSSRQDAIEALVALGFSASEATKAVAGVSGTQDKTAEQIIREALRQR